MNSLLRSRFRTLFEIRTWFLLLEVVQLLAVSSCSSENQMYTIDEQYDLSISRANDLKEDLDFNIQLEKEVVHVGEAIFFTAYFTNKTDDPLTFRLPQQSSVLDIDHANTRIKYSITPIDKTLSLLTPLAYLGTPYILSSPVQSDEFLTLDPHAVEKVELNLQNNVYLKEDETWIESLLPTGEYLIQMTYQNLYVGYEVEKNGHIYVVDKSAWVGQIQAEPVTITVLP